MKNQKIMKFSFALLLGFCFLQIQSEAKAETQLETYEQTDSEFAHAEINAAVYAKQWIQSYYHGLNYWTPESPVLRANPEYKGLFAEKDQVACWMSCKSLKVRFNTDYAQKAAKPTLDACEIEIDWTAWKTYSEAKPPVMAENNHGEIAFYKKAILFFTDGFQKIRDEFSDNPITGQEELGESIKWAVAGGCDKAKVEAYNQVH